MAHLKITGYSDDNIEIDGDLSEEISCYDEPAYIVSSDGTVLKIEYTNDGVWEILPVVSGTAILARVPATGPDGVYTDEVTLNGDIRWIGVIKQDCFFRIGQKEVS